MSYDDWKTIARQRVSIVLANRLVRRDKTISPVNLFWYQDAVNNFGDLAGAYLFERITNRKPFFRIPNDHSTDTVFVTVGSVMSFVRRDSIVWGAGVIDRTTRFPRPYSVSAVRGPRTYLRFKELGYSCPEVFGDPGLLLPRFYTPRVELKYDLGIIPHYVDHALVRHAYDEYPQVLILDVTQPVEAVIDGIVSCRRTVSSSLHGLIVSHAYHVPSALVRYSNRVFGDGVKFQDYCESVNLKPKATHDLPDRPFSLNDLQLLVDDTAQPRILDTLLDDLLESCPFQADPE